MNIESFTIKDKNIFKYESSSIFVQKFEFDRSFSSPYTHDYRLVENLLREIIEDVSTLKKNFENLSSRQLFFVKLKNDFGRLYMIARDEDFSKHLIVILNNCINKMRAENVQNKQIDVLESTVKELFDDNITDDKMELIIKELIDAGFPLISLPEGISKLYER